MIGLTAWIAGLVVGCGEGGGGPAPEQKQEVVQDKMQEFMK